MVLTDRLGSVMRRGSDTFSYYPYGELQSGPVANNQEKFGTYWRDDANGLDYADQRNYGAMFGRFNSPDLGPATSTIPQSWNRYAYSWGDPVNLNDPDGMLPASVDFGPVRNGDGSRVPDWFYSGSGSFVLGGSRTISRLQLLHAVVKYLEDIAGIDVRGPAADGSGYIVDFNNAGAASTGIAVCVVQPELCAVVLAGGTVIITWPHLVELQKAIVHWMSRKTARDLAPVKYDPEFRGSE